MKIIKLLILVFILAVDAHICFAEYYPTTVVSEEYAEFTIQIEPNKNYTWYNFY